METPAQPPPLTVLIIEDHAIVRDGCRRICNRREEFTVIEAATAEEGLATNRRLRPDVMILDLELGRSSGFEIMPKLLAENPKARIVIFSMYHTAQFVSKARELGALGYVTKSDDPNILLTAIDAVSRGDVFLSPIVEQSASVGTSAPNVEEPLLRLTERERDIFGLMGDGKDLSEIAALLGITYKTVANAVASIKAKLRMTTSSALIKLAVELKAKR
jgi:DNA-binding NarL/FixJ family response regulator